MALPSSWSLDFCLHCDTQTTEGPYCSQACRLQDLGSPTSSNTSPTSSPALPIVFTPAVRPTVYHDYNSWTPLALPPVVNMRALQDLQQQRSKSSEYKPRTSSLECQNNSANSSKRSSISSIGESNMLPLYPPPPPVYDIVSSSLAASPVSEDSKEQLRRYEAWFSRKSI